nr:MAG TPA: hypothetical protein [Caudoviricetes sp.]
MSRFIYTILFLFYKKRITVIYFIGNSYILLIDILFIYKANRFFLGG